jgi:hypothetical protein
MKNDENMINGIKSLSDNSYVQAQVSKYNIKKEERSKEIQELGERIVKIDSGEYDTEINSIINNNIKQQEERKRVVDEKRKQVSDYKAEKSKQSTAFYQSTRISDREQRYEGKDMQRSYSYFVKTCNGIPDYISNNLKSMPGNKGYFWKNIACYGELPKEKGQPITLFEKQRGGLLIIHEWTPDVYNVYHKKDKDRKFLYSCEHRKKLKGSILF